MTQSEYFEKARRAAYRFLAYKPRTEYEMAEKLLGKGFDRDTVDQVLVFLRAYKMIDDHAYAERFVARRNSWSRSVMSDRLKGLGVQEKVIQKALEGKDSEAEFRVALAQAMNRRRRRGDNSPESMAAFLRRRGFSHEVSDKVCRYLENLTDPRDLDS